MLDRFVSASEKTVILSLKAQSVVALALGKQARTSNRTQTSEGLVILTEEAPNTIVLKAMARVKIWPIRVPAVPYNT